MNAPSAAKTAEKCDAASSSLIVIDIQERLGSAMPTKVLNRVLANTSLLCRAADLIGIPIVPTEQYPRGLGPTHATVREALPAQAEVVEKTTFSCCDDAGFGAVLERVNRPQVIVAGMEAHICVLQTALDLQTADYSVFVVEDAICSRRLENYQNALDRLRQSGITVVSAESVVFEWMGGAEHPQFKAVQGMLR